MKAAAVVLAASFGLLTAGCTPGKPVERAESTTTEMSSEEASPDPGGRDQAVAEHRGDGNAGNGNLPAQVASRGTPLQSGAGEVRDAKEAAEEAAKKIFNATVGAASRIRDAGMGAVQAVRDSTARKPDGGESEELSEADVGEEEQAEAKPAGS